jgi:hypothetical protein
MNDMRVHATPQAAAVAAIATMRRLGVDNPVGGEDFEVVPHGDNTFGWFDARPQGFENTAAEELNAEALEDRIEIDAEELEEDPYGMNDDVVAAILELGAQIGASKVKPPKVREDAVSRLFASNGGKIVPLEIASQANYTYQRHADRLYELAKAGNRGGVEAYEINGTNTYAKRLKRYRAALLAALPLQEAA